MSLTSQLSNRKSPVARFFAERFPNARGIESSWREALGTPDTIRPAAQSVPWGTIGTAFDYRVRFYFPSLLSREYVARNGARLLRSSKARELYTRLTGMTHPVVTSACEALGDRYFAEFIPALEAWLLEHRLEQRLLAANEELELVRFCYVLALYEELYRAGPHVRSPLYAVGPDPTLNQLLSLIALESTDDLAALSRLFFDTCNHLLNRPVILNPTFEGSLYISGADADLIVDGCLLEIKTTVKPSLSRTILHQLVGYALLDFSDEFSIKRVGVYQARQGDLATWNLDDLLEELVGHPVDLAEMRAAFQALLLVDPEHRPTIERLRSRGSSASRSQRADA